MSIIIEKAFTNHTADVSHQNRHDKIYVRMSIILWIAFSYYTTIPSFVQAKVHLSGEIVSKRKEFFILLFLSGRVIMQAEIVEIVREHLNKIT